MIGCRKHLPIFKLQLIIVSNQPIKIFFIYITINKKIKSIYFNIELYSSETGIVITTFKTEFNN